MDLQQRFNSTFGGQIDILFGCQQQKETNRKVLPSNYRRNWRFNMDARNRIRIGVIGGASPDSEHRQIAHDVGKEIAKKGAILVCGGLGGVMEAAARGAKKNGGLTIGILPGNSPGEANIHIDIPIATGLGYSRNSLVAMNADVLIAVDGQYGTLTEIAYGKIYGKKVIGIGTWDIQGVEKADTAEQAVGLALKNYFPLTS
jgi:uncharacterized protein (TIGR00725 family)